MAIMYFFRDLCKFVRLSQNGIMFLPEKWLIECMKYHNMNKEYYAYGF